MTGRGPIIPLLGLVSGACAQGDQTGSSDARPGTLASLEKLTAGCGFPSGTVTLAGTDQVTLAVRPDADYKKVDCLLVALRKKEPRLKLGFIGNETYEPGKEK